MILIMVLNLIILFFPKTVFRKNLMFKLFSNFQFEVQRKNELKLKFKIQSMKV